jgi:enoyl-CoA hydratase/carnithine racemase
VSDDVRMTVDRRVATITLARAARRNALDSAFAQAIAAAFHDAEEVGATVGVVHSSERVFSAGVDLSEPMRLGPDSPELVVAGTLCTTRLLTVTVVEGPALAGGLMIAALSPWVIASAGAEFWLPERELGIFPSRVLAYLEMVVPARHAFRLSVTQEHIGADEARALGLVTEVVPAGAGLEHAQQLARGLADTSPGYRDSARDSWQARFAGAAFESRRAELDALLARDIDR